MRALALLLLLAACGDDSSPADGGWDLGLADLGADADGGADASADAGSDADDVGVDAGEMDGGMDMSVPDASSELLGDRCEDECARTELEAQAGVARALFDLAFFGVNEDGTLYIEAYGGAEPECPTMMTPSPDRTLIIGSLATPEDTMETESSAVLFDFEGGLTMEPFVRSDSGQLRARALNLMPLESGFLRLDVEYTFGAISVSGALYATHCASLDG